MDQARSSPTCNCALHVLVASQVVEVAAVTLDDESGASIWDSALCLGELLVKQQMLGEQQHPAALFSPPSVSGC